VIAARIAAEEGVVVQTRAAERRRRPPAEPTPYDAMLLAYEFFLSESPESFRPAVEALRSAVHSAPECGPAWTRLARLYAANYAFDVTAIPTPIDEAIACAHRGVRVDPESRRAQWVLASCLLVKGELAAGREVLEQALQSSPGSLAYLEMIGVLLTLLGDWERGQALSRAARERNPHCLPQVLFGTWADGLRRGDFAQAYAAALEYRNPTFFWRAVMRASSLGLLGREPEARAAVADLLSRKPGFRARGRVLLGHYVKFPEVMDRIVEGLARAGLVLDRGSGHHP
jgi:tetratricopeptide (TPR) repeat protein